MQASCDSIKRFARLGDPGDCGLHVQRRDQRGAGAAHFTHQGSRVTTGNSAVHYYSTSIVCYNNVLPNLMNGFLNSNQRKLTITLFFIK